MHGGMPSISYGLVMGLEVADVRVVEIKDMLPLDQHPSHQAVG